MADNTDVTALVTARTTRYLRRFQFDKNLEFTEVQHLVLARIEGEGIQNISIFQTPSPESVKVT